MHIRVVSMFFDKDPWGRHTSDKGLLFTAVLDV